MSEISRDTRSNENNLSNGNIYLITLKLTLNLLCHILVCLVVLVCLWFSCRSFTLSVTQLHIVLCVLGYQFFMSQGVLVLSKFNSWSMHIKRRYRRNLHWFFEIVGTILILVGSISIIKDKHINFTTIHGKLGLCALITTLLSVFNGMMTSLLAKFTSGSNFIVGTKRIHGVSGIATLFLSAASLHYGFGKQSFRRWIDNDDFIIILKTFTWVFTVFVGCEYWETFGRRIVYKTKMRAQRSLQK